MSLFSKIKAFVSNRLGGSQASPAATEHPDLYNIDAHVPQPLANPPAKQVHTAEQKEQILQSEFQDLLADLGHHEEQSLAAMVKDVGAEKLLGKLNAVGGAKNPNRPVLSESEFNQRLNANVAKSPLMNRDFSHVRGKAT